MYTSEVLQNQFAECMMSCSNERIRFKSKPNNAKSIKFDTRLSFVI